MKDKRLYGIWAGMKNRCYSDSSSSAKWYKEKGIKVCKEWKNDFYAFQDWALANGYDDDLTIDRIDPDGNYEPDNCQWITRSDNIRKMSEDRQKKSKEYHEYKKQSKELQNLRDALAIISENNIDPALLLKICKLSKHSQEIIEVTVQALYAADNYNEES